jgi:hypothetical protein
MVSTMDRFYYKAPNPIYRIDYCILAESGNIDPVVALSCIFMEDETSETQVDGIVKR